MVEFPVGAPADVAELEYISALQQTAKKQLRLDATVSAEDIRQYLVSRHGIRREVVEIDELILNQLAASLPASELPKGVIKDKDQDNISSEMKATTTATENDSSNSRAAPSGETLQEFASHRIVPSDIEEEKSEMLCSQLTSNEDVPPETLTTRNSSVTVKESPLIVSRTRELVNGVITFFPFSHTSQSDEYSEDKNSLTHDVETPIILPTAHDEDHENSLQDSESLSVGTFHPVDVLITKGPQENVSLCPEEPELDKRDDIGSDRTKSMEGENCHEPMDMVQQVALLCVPELVRAQKEIQEANHNDDGDDDDQRTNEAKALVEAFLSIICTQCHLEPNITLTKDVLIHMLVRLNESWPDDIVDEMYQVIAPSIAMGEAPLLTAETLMKALTDDVQDFPTEREFLPSTHWKDALSRKPGAPLNRIFTASNIDYTADTYSSFWWANLTSLTLVMTVVAYKLCAFSVVKTEMGKIDCDSVHLHEMGCRLVNSLILWFEIFVQLTIIGFPLIYLSTLGNSVHAQRKSWMTYITFPIGIATVLFYTVVCYSVEFHTKVLNTEKREDRDIFYLGSLLLGIILVIIQVGHFLRLLLPSRVMSKAWFKPFASGMVCTERWTKLSAAFKMQCMLANALFCHSNILDGSQLSTACNQEQNQRIGLRMASTVIQRLHADHSLALLQFQEQVHLRKNGPSRLTIWRQVCSNQIPKEQGIWISPRLGSRNMMQWMIVLLLPVAGNYLWKGADHGIDKWKSNFPALTIGDLRAFIVVGGMGEFLGATYVAASYVPGAISLTMQFRTGLLGSLRDERFLIYRRAQETRTMLHGATKWGLALSVILLWFSLGSFAFFVLSDMTRDLATSILISIVAFLITWTIKEILLNLFRHSWSRGFYCCRPAKANILIGIMDCWNLGFSTMFVVARFIKVFLCLAVNFGQVDVPFLATDFQKFGPLNLDDLPISFRKDLLIHEAHRHPYIERLGLLYLLKLRLGEKFGTRAGGAWRILFVLVFMPWLKRYRKVSIPKEKSWSYVLTTRNRHRDTLRTDLSTTVQDKAALWERNQQLERENAYLRSKLTKYEVTPQQPIRVHGSIFTGSF